MLPCRANGQLSFANYLWDEERRTFAFHGTEVMTLRGDKISEWMAFLDPAGYAIFGLPATLDGPGSLPA